jgi:hypothetical protein
MRAEFMFLLGVTVSLTLAACGGSVDQPTASTEVIGSQSQSISLTSTTEGASSVSPGRQAPDPDVSVSRNGSARRVSTK